MIDDELFWERLAEMPDVEAVQELSLRRTDLVRRKQEIIKYWEGRFTKRSDEDAETVFAIDLTLTKINEEVKLRNRRLDNCSWRNAVRAVCGEEGYVKCREWIMQNERNT